ncbi:unnamed protein product [Moneuplotes crassus]|uniref:Uncharacterized protein n=1 Tax=Euplotes crassus TaxID=5936 RepID=A0AAD2D9E5_EUPCR|nr:unnamed protein product [Moneuplotes crassus]
MLDNNQKSRIREDSKAWSEEYPKMDPLSNLKDNTPLKRAKEMYAQCIEKARSASLNKQSSSNSNGLNSSSLSLSRKASSRQDASNVPEAECMKIHLDLLGKRADLVSPKPVRVKLIYKIDNPDELGKLGDGRKKGQFYERMFKIDTRMKDRAGNLKEGGSIMLNLTNMLSALFNETIDSGKAFDRRAKKIIRSQYRLITPSNVPKPGFPQTEAKQGAQSKLAHNTSTKDSEAQFDNKINGLGSPCSQAPELGQKFPLACSNAFDTNKSSQLEEEISKLQKEIERLSTVVTQLETEHQEKDKVILGIKQEYESKRSQAEALNEENTTFRQVIESQNIRFKEKIDQMAEEKQQKDREIANLINHIRENESQNEENLGFERKLNMLQQQLQEKQQYIFKVEQEYQGLEQDSQTRTQAFEKRVTSLQQEIANLEEQKATFEHEKSTYEQQIAYFEQEKYNFDEAQENQNSKQEERISALMKEKSKLEKEVVLSQNKMVQLQKEMNDTNLQSQEHLSKIQNQLEEINRMNEYISEIKEENLCLKQKYKDLEAKGLEAKGASEDFAEEKDQLNQKIAQLTKDHDDKDQKYIKLMDKLKHNQDQYLALQKEHEAELSGYIHKDQHKAEISKLQLSNQELVKEIKKLHLSLEERNKEEKRLREILNAPKESQDENSGGISHDQLRILKEYSDIMKKMFEYDDSGTLKSGRICLKDSIDKVLSDYDGLVVRYQQVEQQYIDIKLKYAESEEIKERLVTKLEGFMVQGPPRDGSIGIKKIEDKKSEDGLFAKASTLWSGAGKFYSNKFGNKGEEKP